MVAVFCRPARRRWHVSGRLVLVTAIGGWLLTLGLSESAAQQQIVQQGAAVVRQIAGQPAGSSGSPPGGVVGRVAEVGGNAVRKVVGAPPAGQAAPSGQSSPQQGGLMGTAQQAGGNLASKATGGKVSSGTAQQVIGGARTLAQKAITKRSTPAAPPRQASAPQQQGLPVGWPTAQPQRPASGPHPSGAPPS